MKAIALLFVVALSLLCGAASMERARSQARTAVCRATPSRRAVRSPPCGGCSMKTRVRPRRCHCATSIAIDGRHPSRPATINVGRGRVIARRPRARPAPYAHPRHQRYRSRERPAARRRRPTPTATTRRSPSTFRIRRGSAPSMQCSVPAVVATGTAAPPRTPPVAKQVPRSLSTALHDVLTDDGEPARRRNTPVLCVTRLTKTSAVGHESLFGPGDADRRGPRCLGCGPAPSLFPTMPVGAGIINLTTTQYDVPMPDGRRVGDERHARAGASVPACAACSSSCWQRGTAGTGIGQPAPATQALVTAIADADRSTRARRGISGRRSRCSCSRGGASFSTTHGRGCRRRIRRNQLALAIDSRSRSTDAGVVDVQFGHRPGQCGLDRAVRDAIADATPLVAPPQELLSDDDRLHVRCCRARIIARRPATRGGIAVEHRSAA